MTTDNIRDKASRIELLLMDCDGVLTDGRLYYSSAGEEIKVFHVRDGFGLVKWKAAGKSWGIITGRSSECLTRRANELNADHLVQGSSNKLADVISIIDKLGLDLTQVAYIGDDEPDVEALKNVGFSIGVGDAVPEVLANVDFTTQNAGGHGAVREAIEYILSCR